MRHKFLRRPTVRLKWYSSVKEQHDIAISDRLLFNNNINKNIDRVSLVIYQIQIYEWEQWRKKDEKWSSFVTQSWWQHKKIEIGLFNIINPFIASLGRRHIWFP